jgi:cytochrome P450
MTGTDERARLADFTLMIAEGERMDWETLDYARQHCPVFRTSPSDVYVVTKYADVRFVLEHPELFSSADPNVEGALPIRLPPLDTDPPRQQEIRKILNPFFSRTYFSRLENDIRLVADRIIDGFAQRRACEFVRDFAVPFNSAVLAQLVFNETDAERLERAIGYVNAVAEGLRPEAFGEVYGLVGEYVTERENSTDEPEDIIGALLAARIDGEPLSTEERVGVVTALFLGGLNTTFGAMSNIMAHLAADPALEPRLRDPRWVKHDLEEFIRYETPIMAMARTVVRDVQLGSVSLRAGDRLAVHFASANRDDEKFENAGQLDFDRKFAGHAAFGLGIHRCVGMHLARYEIELAFEGLLKRMTNIRLTPGHEVAAAKGIVLAPKELHIEFDLR